MAKIEYDPIKKTVRMSGSLEQVYDYYERKGFFFSREIITRYFLSLKTKPFVILTGISGTGKTKIAQVFADYICQDETPDERRKRIAFVPVRPDWMDNKGLLGYYNLLDEKYHVTQVLRLLLDARKNPEKPYFVILDEMNLAKVEHYFSDFLSIMESRTGDRPEGEALHLHASGMVSAQDGLDDVPATLEIPPNVFFTGTVNVDESTYMFSPKVLDRSNVIEFNEVDLAGYGRGASLPGGSQFSLDDADVRRKLFPEKEGPVFPSREGFARLHQIAPEVVRHLEQLLNILREYHLHFGYRVVNEIAHFSCIANDLVARFNGDEVLDIQILQKVLPKFHGTQGKLEEPLQRLLVFCLGIAAGTEEPGIVGNEEGRFPRSAAKVTRMLQSLRTQGYASFIE